MYSTTFQLFSLALAFASFSRDTMAIPAPVPAVTTLSVPPLFNPESSPLPAVVLGVDSQGRTTYAVEQDAILGTTKTIPLTATLVQGADHAGYTFSASGANFDVEADFDCDLKGGKAECPVTDSNSQVRTFTFSTLQPFVIDVASTAPPSATGKPNSSPGLSASRSGALVGVVVLVAHWVI